MWILATPMYFMNIAISLNQASYDWFKQCDCHFSASEVSIAVSKPSRHIERLVLEESTKPAI